MINEKFRAIVLLFLSLVVLITFIFPLISFNNIRESISPELKIFKTEQLNNSEFLPVFNGECYFSTHEAKSWFENNQIDYQIKYKNVLLNIEELKCLNMIVGSSAVQGEIVENINKSKPVIVTAINSNSYSTFLLFSLLLYSSLIYFKILKDRLLILLIFLTFSYLIFRYIFSINFSTDIYFWLILVIFLILNKRLFSENQLYVCIFISFLLTTIDINLITLAFFLFFYFLFSKFENVYLNKVILFFGLTYCFGKFRNLSYSFRTNNDHYVWINNAYRSNYLDMYEYKAAWEHKGSLIMKIYELLIKVFGLKNIWDGMSILYLFISLICCVIVYRVLNEKSGNSILSSLVSLVLLIMLTSEQNQGLLKLDTRFIGSTLMLVAIYLFYKERNFLAGAFIATTFLNLVSFLIPAAFMSLLILFQNKNNFKNITQYFYGGMLVTSLYFIYLLLTDQLYEFYKLNIDFNLNLQDSYLEFSFKEAVKKYNLLISLNVALVIVFLNNKNRKIQKLHYLLITWFLSEILHLYLTGPRFEDYTIILLIPSVFLAGLLILENSINFKKTIVLFFVFSTLIGFNSLSKFPMIHFGESLFSFGDQLFMSQDTAKDKYAAFVIPDKFEDSQTFGFVFLKNDEDKFSAIYKYNLIPATRINYYTGHWRPPELESAYKGYFSDDEFAFYFNQDLLKEGPTMALVDIDLKSVSTHLNLFSNYLEKYFDETQCNSRYCIFVKR